MAWKKITTIKLAGGITSLIVNEENSGHPNSEQAVLYDDTSGEALGPVFNNYSRHYMASEPHETADRFVRWHQRTYGDPRDEHRHTLRQRVSEFFDKFHAFSPYETLTSKVRGFCNICGKHYDKHAEARFAQQCRDCGGTGVKDGRSCWTCDGVGRGTGFFQSGMTDEEEKAALAFHEHDGLDESGNFIENEVGEEESK